MMRRASIVWLVLSLGLVGSAFGADTYTADPAHSSIGFKIKHLGISTVQGQFKDYTGKVLFDKDDPTKSSVEVSVKAASVDTSNTKRDDHLRSKSFFNVAEFPTLGFKSTSVKKIDDATYEITGGFTLLGVTKPITVQLTDVAFGKGMKGEDRAGGEIKFKIKRSDYGMNFMVGPVGDDVDIDLYFEAVKGA
jgi:polyisoprenoid-binding protein YceI